MSSAEGCLNRALIDAAVSASDDVGEEWLDVPAVASLDVGGGTGDVKPATPDLADANHLGGAPGSGGATGTGGTTGNGGTTGSGGTVGTGGATASGGSPSAPVTYEVETLARTASAVGTSLSNDPNASNGTYVQFNGTSAVGNWMEFTIPNLAAATYSVQMLYKANTDRGTNQASIDGVDQGSTCDEYASSPVFKVTCGLGSKALTAGAHQFRFTVIGKNSSSSGYAMTIDSIVLTATAP